MPIRAIDRARYPANWKAIRADGLTRAQNRCDGSPRYPDCRAANRQPHPVTGSRVILTIGHLDHTPEHCEFGNLRAWCQRCNLAYDEQHHAQTAYMTRRAHRAIADLFAEA
ncbi:hypothetical protein [Caballeronia cordobensis]|uniref:hypothetical protein n=1 Tax=Caballeronia cordobensis TaxID=1353886 RepID=UPI00045EF19F|nr:putative membrane protein [Burkholderia sp. RPE67]